MQIHVDMTFEQYFEACRYFCTKTTLWRRINYYGILYGYLLLGTGFAVLAISSVMNQMWGWTIWNVAASVFFFWMRLRYPARVRKMYGQQAKHLAGTMTLDTDGMRFQRDNGTADTKYTWAAFDSWIERPEMFMVLLGPTMFFRIPKDKLTGEEQSQIRGWLSSSKFLT